tara:strand:+ start:212 stop:835 length:624 start_codon:yes stop_codon:yes gene_type:complete
MALSNATRLADFGTGIGTLGAVLKVDNTNKRIGLGTTNPQRMVQVGQNITLDDSGINCVGGVGVITAISFSGSGANLTGIAVTSDINTNNIAVSGIATVGTSITMRDGAINVTGVITATSFKGDGSGLTGVSGFGTAMNSTQDTLGNLIYKTPRHFHATGVTSTYVVAGATSGGMAYTRLGQIRLGTGSTMHIGAGTTLVMNVLSLF